MDYLSRNVLGTPFDDLDLSPNIALVERNDLNVDSEVESGWFVEAMDQSWEMQLDGKRIVDRNILSPKRFSILNLEIKTNRAYVRGKYGIPLNSGNTSSMANVSDGAWDEYVINGARFHFEYQKPLMTLVLVAMSRASKF